ncbi:17156_t:CDS:2, partial [Racocetra persica]
LAQPYFDELFQTIEWLTGLVPKDKNHSADTQSTNDYLIQFCHGAPGIVPAFLKIYSFLERGILRKGATGLCHNTLGNAYTFLMTYLVIRDEEQLKRALAFGLYG